MPVTRWMRRATMAAGFGLFVAAITCGPSSGPAQGSIEGTITYDGAAGGGGRALSIAVYKTYPPKGPPLATQLLQHYQLPYHYRFSGLEPGTYYVGALIDVDPADTRYPGMLNAARDPYGYVGGGQPVKVAQLQGAAGADVRLEDPQ
jgi:hypothetical protein